MTVNKDKKVLVVGATGNLGGLVVRALVRRGADVVGLVRPDRTPAGPFADLADVPNFGVTSGDILQPVEDLTQVLRGYDTVVSVVTGDHDVVSQGQRNLIRAADAAGVRRLVPSDFSIDLHKIPYGRNVLLDYRKRADEEFQGRNIRWNPVLTGVFMEFSTTPYLKVVDWVGNTFTYWGDGDVTSDYTTMPDTAEYVAASVLDPDMEGKVVRASANQLSMLEVHEIMERTTGRKLRVNNPGSTDDLLGYIERLKIEATDPLDYIVWQYHSAQQSGLGRLDPLDNDRFPDIKPTSLGDYLAGRLASGQDLSIPPATSVNAALNR